MDKFYKYMTAETAIKVLTDSTLVYKHPHNFNDPFDYYPIIEEIGLTKYFKRVEKEHGKKYLYPNQNYKSLRASLKDFRSTGFREKISSICSVTCFSKSPHILPMWAHYGADHTGCVIEFRDATDDELREVRARGILAHHTNLLIPFPVIYSEARPKIFDANGNSGTDTTGFNSCFIKAKAWEYEQEVRVVKEQKEGIYTFPTAQISAIHFGMKTDPSIKKEIYELIKKTNHNNKISIKCYQTVMEFNTFNLTKTTYR